MPRNSILIAARGRPDAGNAARSRGRRWLAMLVAALGIAVVLYFVAAFLVLSATLTPKRKLPKPTPQEIGFVAERLRFQSATDGTPLSGWLLPRPGSKAIVLVHGLDTNGWANSQPDLARSYLEAGFTVLVFDLRGHGRSGDARLGLGWDERGDVRAAIDLLLSRGFKPGHIGIHGTSYGAATTLLASAAIPEIGAVVADSAFADVRDLMTAQIQRRTRVPQWLAESLVNLGVTALARLCYGIDFDQIPPERAVPEVKPRPSLFIHGDQDDVIPVAHSYRLKRMYGGKGEALWVLRGMKHTEGMRVGPDFVNPSTMRNQYLRKVVAFFQNSLK